MLKRLHGSSNLTSSLAALLPRRFSNSEQLDKSQSISRGFKISRVLAKRRLTPEWIEALPLSQRLGVIIRHSWDSVIALASPGYSEMGLFIPLLYSFVVSAANGLQGRNRIFFNDLWTLILCASRLHIHLPYILHVGPQSLLYSWKPWHETSRLPRYRYAT